MEDVVEGPLEVCVDLDLNFPPFSAEPEPELATSFLPRAFIN